MGETRILRCPIKPAGIFPARIVHRFESPRLIFETFKMAGEQPDSVCMLAPRKVTLSTRIAGHNCAAMELSRVQFW